MASPHLAFLIANFGAAADSGAQQLDPEKGGMCNAILICAPPIVPGAPQAASAGEIHPVIYLRGGTKPLLKRI